MMNTSGVRLLLGLLLGVQSLALAEDVPTNQPWRVALELTDGSRLFGVPGVNAIPVHTAFGKVDIPLSKLARLEFKADRESATVFLQNGDRLSCVPVMDSLPLTTLLGILTIRPEHIRALAVSSASGLVATMPEGVVLYFACDNPARAADLSGREHHGALEGVTLTEDRFGRAGGAYHFAGAQRVTVPDHEDFNLGQKANKTFALWWKGEGDIYHKSLLTKDSVANDGRGLNVLTKTKEGYYLVFQTHHMAQFGPGLTAGQWEHMVVVKDGIDWHTYQNGVEATINSSRGYPLNEDLTVPVPLEIGGNEKHPDYSFIGAIDDICVFNRALSAEEVRQLYEQQRAERK